MIQVMKNSKCPKPKLIRRPNLSESRISPKTECSEVWIEHTPVFFQFLSAGLSSVSRYYYGPYVLKKFLLRIQWTDVEFYVHVH